MITTEFETLLDITDVVKDPNLLEFYDLSEKFCENNKLTSIPTSLDRSSEPEVLNWAFNEIELLVRECRLRRFILPENEGGILLRSTPNEHYERTSIDPEKKEILKMYQSKLARYNKLEQMLECRKEEIRVILMTKQPLLQASVSETKGSVR